MFALSRPSFRRFRRVAKSGVLVCALLLSALPVLTAATEVPTPQRIGYAPLKVPNACLPDAAGFRAAYEVYTRTRSTAGWSRLLLVYKTEQETVRAHAYCVFTLEGRLWTYDQVAGSQRALLDLTDKNDAGKLGRVLGARGFVRAAWADQTL